MRLVYYIHTQYFFECFPGGFFTRKTLKSNLTPHQEHETWMLKSSIEQLKSNLSWLENERRKDKTALDSLEARLANSGSQPTAGEPASSTS